MCSLAVSRMRFRATKPCAAIHAPRKAGWDTHGLPVEHEIEKELGIFDKKEIEEKVGIDEFTRRCRESVMRYIGDWEKMTERMGFWVRMDEAYYTLDNSYIESVWSLLKTIWDKDLIYPGTKWCRTTRASARRLSSHELALGYREVEDPSVFVRFRRQRRRERLVPRMDDDSLDVAGEPAARGAPRHRLRVCRSRRRDTDTGRGAVAKKSCAIPRSGSSSVSRAAHS